MKKLKNFCKELYPFVVYISIVALFTCLATWIVSPIIDKNTKRFNETKGQRIEKVVGDVKSIKQELYILIVDSFVKCETQTILFDWDGNYLEKKIYDFEGKLASTFSFLNYGGHQTAEIVQKNSDGKLLEKTLFMYNSDNFLVEKQFYNSDWRLTRKAIINYNSDLEKISEIILDSAGNEIIEKKYFYSEGKCTKEILKKKSDGYSVEIPYDDKGNPLIISDFTIKYEYDYEGSWVKRSLYRGNELTFIEVREIEYRDYEY